jgi:hypothetical protein
MRSCSLRRRTAMRAQREDSSHSESFVQSRAADSRSAHSRSAQGRYAQGRYAHSRSAQSRSAPREFHSESLAQDRSAVSRSVRGVPLTAAPPQSHPISDCHRRGRWIYEPHQAAEILEPDHQRRRRWPSLRPQRGARTRGSPREGARSELASGAATGGGGRRLPRPGNASSSEADGLHCVLRAAARTRGVAAGRSA